MPILQANKIITTSKTLGLVFSRPPYILLATLAGGGLLLVLSVVPHFALLRAALISPTLTVAEKSSFLWEILQLLGANMSSLHMVVSVLVALLFGVQSALLLFYVRRRRSGAGVAKRAHITSVGGLVAAIFGIGCAACGSVVISAVLGLFGATGLLAVLPLQGLEFGLFGIGLLLLAISYLAQRIADPLVCVLD